MDRVQEVFKLVLKCKGRNVGRSIRNKNLVPGSPSLLPQPISTCYCILVETPQIRIQSTDLYWAFTICQTCVEGAARFLLVIYFENYTLLYFYYFFNNRSGTRSLKTMSNHTEIQKVKVPLSNSPRISSANSVYNSSYHLLHFALFIQQAPAYFFPCQYMQLPQFFLRFLYYTCTIICISTFSCIDVYLSCLYFIGLQ